ncbi:MAG: hypothetical protein A2621_01580 [Alphaproteobacteria bacterium RIFCSPHIGHO2_01_FULL_41_14]|nr:MAG: hypothetical protein A2621_01580 [Alphaproteobacteria bacterium RIFCSPHIGHO2_01_FULL_41_14]HCI48500.1 hypothetical protein [Holosporales bacterium]
MKIDIVPLIAVLIPFSLQATSMEMEHAEGRPSRAPSYLSECPTDPKVVKVISILKKKGLWEFYEKTGFDLDKITDPLIYSNIFWIESHHYKT